MDALGRAGDLRAGFAVFLVTAVCYLATTNYGPTYFVDGLGAAAPAWAMVQHGHVWVDGILYPHAYFLVGSGGHSFTNRAPGLFLFAAPFYVLAKPWTSNHFSAVPAAIAAATYSAAAVGVFFVLLRQFLGSSRALIACIFIALGTSMWSVAAAEYVPHGPDALVLALAMLAYSRGHHWSSGWMLALGITLRPYLCFVALIFGIGAAWERRSIRPLIAFGVPSVVSVAAYMGFNKYAFGHVNIGAGYNHYVTDPLPASGSGRWSDLLINLAGSLISLPRGVLTLSPLLAVLMFGLPHAWRVAPTWMRVCSIAGVAYLVTHFQAQTGSEGFVGGGPFYAYRYPIESLVLTAPLLALAWPRWAALGKRRRRLLGVTFVASLWIHGVGALIYDPSITAPWHPWLAWSPLIALSLAPVGLLGLAVLVLVAAVLGAWIFAAKSEQPLPPEERVLASAD